MKFPSYEEMGQEVANRALDEIEYKGKTLRQWIEIISASEHGTNLAEVGTDCISRQQAIDALRTCYDTEMITMDNGDEYINYGDAVGEIEQLPPIQPEIVRCKDCKHFEYDHPYIIQGIPVLGHEVCNAWGDGCKTDENGYCFMAERKTDEQTD